MVPCILRKSFSQNLFEYPICNRKQINFDCIIYTDQSVLWWGPGGCYDSSRYRPRIEAIVPNSPLRNGDTLPAQRTPAGRRLTALTMSAEFCTIVTTANHLCCNKYSLLLFELASVARPFCSPFLSSCVAICVRCNNARAIPRDRVTTHRMVVVIHRWLERIPMRLRSAAHAKCSVG